MVRRTFTTKRVFSFISCLHFHSISWNREPLRTPASSIYSSPLPTSPSPSRLLVVVVLLFLWLIRPICHENIPVFILTTLPSPENRRPAEQGLFQHTITCEVGRLSSKSFRFVAHRRCRDRFRSCQIRAHGNSVSCLTRTSSPPSNSWPPASSFDFGLCINR